MFLSQPLLPILYVFYPVYDTLVGVVLISILWLLVRYRFANLQLAVLGALWVRLKWITIPIGVYLLFGQHRYVAAAVALLTPWLAGFLNYPVEVAARIMHSPTEVGTLQRIFLESVGLYDPSQFTSVG